MSSHSIEAKRARAIALQEAFFAAPNRCDVGILGDSPEDRHGLQASLRRHATGATDRSFLLPFREAETGPTAWFACAKSATLLRAMLEEIRGFLGPSYVDECPPDRSPDAADLHALPIIEAAGWKAIRFDTRTAKGDSAVLRQWRLYEDLITRRPRAASYVPRTFHQLRAAFDRALLAQNEAEARSALLGMRERFGVSAENRQFLEIRLNAAFGRWEVIAQHPLLAQLIHLQLPPETYGDVIEALYRTGVQEFESGTSLEPVLQSFRSSVADAAQPLFSTRRTSRRPAVAKAFILHELIQQAPQLVLCERLLSDLPVGAFGAVDQLVRQRCAQQTATASIDVALEALAKEQFDRAWELFWPLTDSVDVLRGLVACARECEDPAKVEAILSRLGAANDEIRDAVESASAVRLARLRAGYQSPPMPKRLSGHFARWPDEPEDRYADRLTEFARSVNTAELLAEAGVADVAIDVLMRLAVESPALLERVYPLWHELFIERIEADPRLMRLYVEMLETLRARDVFQRSDLELIHQILVAIVDSGDDASYTKSVNVVAKIFEAGRSPQILGWALDVCDSLSQKRVRDADARLRLLTQVVQACIDFSSRLEPIQRHQLQILAEEAKLDPPKLPSPPEPFDREAVSAEETPYRVALYSLEEAATRRAVEILKSLHPRWTIDTNADLVCSDRLKALAKRADVFVFAWRCSKHAAYYCVKASSQRGNLVMARGVGTSSLVAAAEEYLLGRQN